MGDEATSEEETPDRGPLEKVLSVFGDLRRGEGTTALLMTLHIFVAMFAYYVLKTIREGLILAIDGGAEIKSYASGLMAVALLPVLGLYNWLAGNVATRTMIFSVLAFFVLCIQGFFLSLQAELPVGIVFFVWVGIFNLSVPALFWSFANEVYSREAGERIFPVVGIGMTGGAFAGSFLAGDLFDEGTSPSLVLQVAAGLLVLHGVVYAVVLSRPEAKARTRQEGDDEGGLLTALKGFRTLVDRPYVRLIAALILLLNLVNTTGEYVLSKYVVGLADDALAAAGEVADPEEWKQTWIGAFYGDFFLWVNVISVGLQAFVASRLVKIFGIAGLLFALPIVSGTAYLLAAFGAGFAVFRWAKSAENATDYSIMNTARAMIWLPTTREEKYMAKQTVDTFVVRIGDLVSAGLVFVGTEWLTLGPRGFAGVNVALVAVWLGLAFMLLRSYRALSEERDLPDDAPS